MAVEGAFVRGRVLPGWADRARAGRKPRQVALAGVGGDGAPSTGGGASRRLAGGGTDARRWRNGHEFNLAWLFFCVFLSVACLCGCARKPDAGDLRVVVSLPQWFYPSAERPWAERVWQELRTAHPGATLELELSPGRTEQVLARLLVVRAAGEGPDLACIRMQWAGELAERGALVPLEGVVPESVWQEMLPSLEPAARVRGGLYQIPYDVGVRVILYREDLFREQGIPEPAAGWTRQDLVRAARVLTLDRNNDGTTDQWGFGLPAARHEKTVLQWLPWFWSLGGEFPEGGDGAPPLLRSDASVGAMQWYRDLVREHRVTPATCYAMDQAAVFQGLAGGVFAMTLGGSWEPALLRVYSRHGPSVKVAPLPSMAPGVPPVTLADGWGFVMLTRDPEKQKVIARVLAALASPLHQVEKYEAGGMLSPFRALYRDPGFLADPAAGVLADAVLGARPVPHDPSFPLVRDALEIALHGVLMNNADPATVLEAQQAALEDGFRRSRERRGPDARPGTPEPAGHGDPPAEVSAQRPLPPRGCVLLLLAGEGEERFICREELLAMERRAVGDLELVPLASFLAQAEPGDVLVQAADGFKRRVPYPRLADAFLDPESLYLYLVGEPGGRTFTVRDVTQITLEPGQAPDGLEIVTGKTRYTVSAWRLREMVPGGVLSFRTLVEKTLGDPGDGAKVRLTARDGYSREVAAGELLGGRLHLEGMKCEFPGLPSRDQVSGLVRIEVL